MSILCSTYIFHTHPAILSSLELNIAEVSKYQLLETSLSWFSSNVIFLATLDQFSGRQRDLFRQIGPIRRQDSLQSYNLP